MQRAAPSPTRPPARRRGPRRRTSPPGRAARAGGRPPPPPPPCGPSPRGGPPRAGAPPPGAAPPLPPRGDVADAAGGRLRGRFLVDRDALVALAHDQPRRDGAGLDDHDLRLLGVAAVEPEARLQVDDRDDLAAQVDDAAHA